MSGTRTRDPESPAATPFLGTGAGRTGDVVFWLLVLGAGLTVLAILALIAVTTGWEARTAFSHEGLSFITSSDWNPRPEGSADWRSSSARCCHR